MTQFTSLDHIKLLEALTGKRFDKGVIKFSTSNLADFHIQEVVKELAKATSMSVNDIIKHLNEAVNALNADAKIAPTLYTTMIQNAVESELFTIYRKADRTKFTKKHDFDNIIFQRLWGYIKIEHPSFFPMRNHVDKKSIRSADLRPIVIPHSDPKIQKRFESVDTACATPKGEFVFNLAFMQQLLDYAAMKQVKGNTKKYVSKGGDIPDEYAYIEFVIMHEFMHYTYADFHYMEKLKGDPTIINYVGDFRTNYILVKSGYNQLPIGLFNDDINYDRQRTYREMYDIVKDELDKLKKAHPPQPPGNGPGPDGPDWQPKVGDTVRLPDGSPGKVTAVNGDDVSVVKISN